jgi:hypothetical protein
MCDQTISRCSTARRKRPTLLGPVLALAFTILGRSYGLAEDRAPAAADPRPNTIDSLTGKERLGRKWMDEQRIDNCKVPPDKQGGKLRSSACPHVPMG